MSFKRQPLLAPEVEEQFKEEFLPLWLQGMPAEVGGTPEKKLLGREIAEKLELGIKGSPYEKIPTSYTYFYRLKWQKLHMEKPKKNPLSFPHRGTPSFGLGKQRYKVSPEELDIIEPEEFIEMLNEKIYQDSFWARRARSFLIVLFYSPLRSSEIYERTIDNFKITKSKVIISLLRKKKGHKETDKKEPAEIDRVLPLVDELVVYLKGEEWKTEKEGKVNLRPWNISHDTARNYVRELYPDGYPHWFRFNWITKRLNNPKISIVETRTEAYLTMSAMEHYVMATKRVRESLHKKIVEEFREKGLVK